MRSSQRARAAPRCGSGASRSASSTAAASLMACSSSERTARARRSVKSSAGGRHGLRSEAPEVGHPQREERAPGGPHELGGRVAREERDEPADAVHPGDPVEDGEEAPRVLLPFGEEPHGRASERARGPQRVVVEAEARADLPERRVRRRAREERPGDEPRRVDERVGRGGEGGEGLVEREVAVMVGARRRREALGAERRVREAPGELVAEHRVIAAVEGARRGTRGGARGMPPRRRPRRAWWRRGGEASGAPTGATAFQRVGAEGATGARAGRRERSPRGPPPASRG